MSDEQLIGAGSGPVEGGSGSAPTPVDTTSVAAAAPPSTPASDFELTWNGKTQRVPLDRARELAQMGYDYTQKMQRLAEERRGWEGERSQYEQALQEVRAFLEDKARVEAYMKQQWGQAHAAAQQAASADPFAEPQPLTREEAAKMLEQERQQIATLTQQQMVRQQAEWEVRQMAEQYNAEFASAIKGFTEQWPELRAIPQLTRVLKEEVAAMKPTTLDEAKLFMREAALKQAERIRDLLAEERKKAIPPPVLTNGIEPPGGTGPLPVPAPRTYKKITDPGFKASIVADMERLMRQGGGTGT